MIEAELEGGRRIFVPMDQIKAVTQNSEKELTLVYLRHNNEMAWTKILSFQILATGKRVS